MQSIFKGSEILKSKKRTGIELQDIKTGDYWTVQSDIALIPSTSKFLPASFVDWIPTLK